MQGPRAIGWSWRRAWFLALLVLGAAAIGLWSGCSTPRERYRTLSFFFDGVPDPDAPKPVPGAKVVPGAKAPVVLVTHKPYGQGNCDACHRNAQGEIMDFSLAANPATCLKCHGNKPKQYPRMHGPVATAACTFCHLPHESPEPHLLKAPPRQLCAECHDANLLGDFPPQHIDGVTQCTECHSGHGGTKPFFLLASRPTTAPATGPSSQPASQPATAPAGVPAATQRAMLQAMAAPVVRHVPEELGRGRW